MSLQVICDLTIAASMVYYLYTRCTRVKQYVNLQCVCHHADDGFLVQDNQHGYDTRAIFHY